jgi:signal transduction histidine kinase
MFYHHLDQMVSDVALINTAGRQRMLSKQLFIYAEMVHHGQEEDRGLLRETSNEFEQALRALEGGGKIIEYDISPVPTEASAELARLRKTWVGYQEAVSQLAALPLSAPLALAAFEYIDSNTQGMTDDANRLVTALQVHSEQRQRQMLYILTMIAIFDLLLLGFGVWLVRRYIAERRCTAAELETKATELERSNRELGRFAYVASHDIKTPLRAIANLSQWIEEDLGDQLEGATRKQMDLLRGRVYRMEALIDGILEYARVGRIDTGIETVDVAKLLNELLTDLAPPPGFTIDIASDMPVFETARMPLSQMFANLIDNAINHYDRGDGHLHITVQDMEDFYEFTVTDDGPGIAPEFHDKVFQIFQTLQARNDIESTGVSLSLVKKIVEEQGGTITLDSVEGACFRFTWPKRSRSETGQQQNMGDAQPAENKLRRTV